MNGPWHTAIAFAAAMLCTTIKSPALDTVVRESRIEDGPEGTATDLIQNNVLKIGARWSLSRFLAG
ncbi:MAG: hypothetical protein ABSC06_14100 [Rhodopila sp.]